jgi:hypothetical protein
MPQSSLAPAAGQRPPLAVATTARQAAGPAIASAAQTWWKVLIERMAYDLQS